MEKGNKQLYSYKKGLEQPIFVKELSENVSLPSAVKMGTLFYFVGFFPLFYFLLMLIPFFEWTWAVVGAGFLAWNLGNVFMEFRLDGKTTFIYLKDSLLEFLSFQRKASNYYINKGQLYRKVKKR